MSAPSGSESRIWYLEWLRVGACLAVVLIHCFSTVLDNLPIAGIGLGRAIAWSELVLLFGRWAVPVFFMVSGALLLDPERELGWLKIRNYVTRMVLVLLTFGVCFALVELIYEERGFSLDMFPQAFVAILREQSWSHLWYVYDLIGIYLLLPLLRGFVATYEERGQLVLLCVLAVNALFVPTANGATGFGLVEIGWLNSSVFYVLLGSFLHRYSQPRFVSFCGAACAAISVIIIGVGMGLTGKYSALSWVWSPFSPLIAAYSASIFLFAKEHLRKPAEPRAARTLSELSSMSFAIYLVHPVMCNLLYKALDWLYVPLPPLAFETVTYALIFGSSVAAAKACKVLPMIRGLV